MAAQTKAELRNRVLTYLGVLAAGETARAEDAALVDSAIDASHAMLRGLELAPFSTDEIPEWAQLPFRDYVAGTVVSDFGLGLQRRAEVLSAALVGRQSLSAQVNNASMTSPLRVRFY